MGIWRFAKFSRNARTLACVDNRLSSPKVGVTIGDGHLIAPTILIDPDCSTTIGLPFRISAPHAVAARLVVDPDDVRDVGVGNERYDAVMPSGRGVGSKVDGGHCKSSPAGGFVSGRASPGPSESLYMCAFGASA
jgi:hypothetical protein